MKVSVLGCVRWCGSWTRESCYVDLACAQSQSTTSCLDAGAAIPLNNTLVVLLVVVVVVAVVVVVVVVDRCRTRISTLVVVAWLLASRSR